MLAPGRPTIQRQAADEQRFTRLVETTGPRVLAYLSRLVDPPGDAADVLAEVLVRDALTRLPADDREPLTLVAWDGLRTDEAAALMGITSAAARQRLVRARRRLRAQLDEATGPTSGDSGPATFTPTDTWPRAPARR